MLSQYKNSGQKYSLSFDVQNSKKNSIFSKNRSKRNSVVDHSDNRCSDYKLNRMESSESENVDFDYGEKKDNQIQQVNENFNYFNKIENLGGFDLSDSSEEDN